MKRSVFAPKWLAVATFAVAVGSLAAAAAVFTYASRPPLVAAAAPPVNGNGHGKNGNGNGNGNGKRLEKQRIAQLERYTRSLGELLLPKSPPEVDLAPFFERPQRHAAARAPAHTLSMIWRSGEQALVLIDGRLDRVGDRLPGGARVVGVESSAVWLERGGRRTRLEVSSDDAAAPGAMELRFHAAG